MGNTVAVCRGANHLFSRCFITGVTDMTWGFGRAAFVDTTFYVRKFVQNGIRYSGNIATFGTGPARQRYHCRAITLELYNRRSWNHLPGEALPARVHCGVCPAATWAIRFLRTGGTPSGTTSDAKQYDFVEYDSRGPGAKKLREVWESVPGGASEEVYSDCLPTAAMTLGSSEQWMLSTVPPTMHRRTVCMPRPGRKVCGMCVM